MKRNRLIRLKEADGKCEVCGNDAFCIHHLDGSKDNHEMDNLAVVCTKCHGILHTNDGRQPSNTKYTRLYGMTLKEMVTKFGGTSPTFVSMHKRGELQEYLDRHEKVENGNLRRFN